MFSRVGECGWRRRKPIMHQAMAVRAQRYDVPPSIAQIRMEAVNVGVGLLPITKLTRALLKLLSEIAGQPRLIWAHTGAFIVGLTKTPSPHGAAATVNPTLGLGKASPISRMARAAATFPIPLRFSTVYATAQGLVRPSKHAPMLFAKALGLMRFATALNSALTTLGFAVGNGAGLTASAGRRTATIYTTHLAKLAAAFGVVTNAQAPGRVLSHTPFNATGFHRQTSRCTLYHRDGQKTRRIYHAWDFDGHTSRLLSGGRQQSSVGKATFRSFGRLNPLDWPIKTLSDQWGKPEMATLTKQAQAVQVQRLSERAPFRVMRQSVLTGI